MGKVDFKVHVALFFILAYVINSATVFPFSCHHDWICPTDEEDWWYDQEREEGESRPELGP
jgi:hypothetical protein